MTDLLDQRTATVASAADRLAVLNARLAARRALLTDRLSRLYGDAPGHAEWFDALIERVFGAALRRPAALWRLDQSREADPGWFGRGGVAYCAYTDRFAGTLSGVADRVAHLQSLGVTYLHLLPFLEAGSGPNDGGFAVASYERVAPALGNWDELGSLTAQLRAAGISLCSDLVLNHVSHDHAWAQAALRGDARYAGFFHWVGDAAGVADWERHLPQVFPDTAPGNFTWIEARSAWVRTTFYPYQWDLNWANSEVFTAMVEALLNLANQGVEAFRLDSTGYLWKREGTDCLNQPEVHDILQALRAIVDIAAPAVLLKAEAIMPTRDLPPYFGLGERHAPECHLAYHSSLMAAAWAALARGDASLPDAVLAGTPPVPDGTGWLSYVRCHDDIGWNVLRPELQDLQADADAVLLEVSQHLAGLAPGSAAQGESFQTGPGRPVHGTNGMLASLAGLRADQQTGNEADLAVERILLLQSLSFLAGDLPMLYMGDEYGQTNLAGQALVERLAAGGDGRELHRPDFDAQALHHAADPRTPGGRILDGVRRLARLRRSHPQLLRRPLDRLPSGHPAVLALRRAEAVVGLFNFSAQPVRLDLSAVTRQHGSWRDLLGARDVASDLELPPFGRLWLLAKEMDA